MRLSQKKGQFKHNFHNKGKGLHIVPKKMKMNKVKIVKKILMSSDNYKWKWK